MSDNLKIELSVDEVNAVLSVLSTQPYRDVALLIATIKVQADSQVTDSKQQLLMEGAEASGFRPSVV